MKKYILLASVAAVVAACNIPAISRLDWAGMIGVTSPGVDDRFQQSITYHQQHPISDVQVPSEDYLTYILTDTHVFETTRNLDSIIRAANGDDRCQLVLHLGDMIDATGNYSLFDASWQKLQKPAFVTDGNHDLYFKQWTDFIEYHHTSTYSFNVVTPAGKCDRYICLDTGSGTLGAKQTQWLREQLEDAREKKCRHIFIFTHTHIFKRDNSQGTTSNLALEETYELTHMLSTFNVDRWLSGHDHCREIDEYKGVKYIVVDSSQDKQEKPAYMVMHVGENVFEEFVSLPLNPGGKKD